MNTAETESDSIVIGNYVIFRRNLAYADLNFRWRKEVRHYGRDGVFASLSRVTYEDKSGVKLVFGNGTSLTFPDDLPETTTLRAWLTGEETGPAGLSPMQAEGFAGLPEELAAAFKKITGLPGELEATFKGGN